VEDNLRNEVAVDQDPSFKLDALRVLAVVLDKLAQLRRPPAVNRDLERVVCWKTGNEAGHDGHAHPLVNVAKFVVRNHMASNLELLERNVLVLSAGEENDIPVLVTHFGELADKRVDRKFGFGRMG